METVALRWEKTKIMNILHVVLLIGLPKAMVFQSLGSLLLVSWNTLAGCVLWPALPGLTA